MSARLPEPLFAGQHILFIGDSITNAGRRSRIPPHGDGYLGQAFWESRGRSQCDSEPSTAIKINTREEIFDRRREQVQVSRLLSDKIAENLQRG